MSFSNGNHISGGQTELAALSRHNQYLNSCDNTLFQQAYARISNFAITEEAMIPQNSPAGLAAWPATQTLTEITQSGDLCLGVDLTCELGGIAEASQANPIVWTPAVGMAMIECVRVKIGGQPFEDFDETYIMGRDELFASEGKRHKDQVGDYGLYKRATLLSVADIAAGDDAAIRAHNKGDADVIAAAQDFSRFDRKIHVHLPVHFDGFSAPGNALNLIGLQRHKVEIEINIRAREKLLQTLTVTPATGVVAIAAGGTLASTSGVMKSFKLVCHMVHLGETERGIRATTPETGMYIVPQKQSPISISSSDSGALKQVANYFNHPVTHFMWMYRSAVAENENDWFRFGSYEGAKVADAHKATYFHPQRLIDPVASFELLFNGYSRTSGPSEFFQQAVPMRRANRRPSRLVNMYSFAFDAPDRSRHTGAVNLSMIDSKQLCFTMREEGTAAEKVALLTSAPTTGTVASSTAALTGKIFFWADTIKFYRHAGGMRSTLFAN